MESKEIKFEKITNIKDHFLPFVNILYQISFENDYSEKIEDVLIKCKDFFQDFLSFFENNANPYWYIKNSDVNLCRCETEDIMSTTSILINTINEIVETKTIVHIETIQSCLDILRHPLLTS